MGNWFGNFQKWRAQPPRNIYGGTMANSDFLFDELPVQFAPQSISQSGLGAVWTQHKAQLIAKYIFLFTMITRHGAYIDGFAGPKNDKLTDSWAAELVVNMEPRRLREVFLCDLDPIKVRKLEEMVGAQTDVNKRKYRIYSGDFNERIRDILSSGLIKEKTATFCLIDQFTLECHWETLRQIATHKPVGARKIEVFYFLGTGWLHRALTGHKRNITRPDLWWGRRWLEKLYKLRAVSIFAIRMAERFSQ